MFSLYLLILLLFLCGTFFMVYQFLIRQQIDTTLYQSSNLVISNYILLENDQLKLKLDNDGRSLKGYFLSQSMSGIIFDSTNSVYKAYGIFALMDNDNQEWLKFTGLVMSNATKNNKTVDYPLSLGKVTMLATPLKYHDQQVGTLVLGKSWEEYNQAKSTILLVIAFMGMLGLLGSFLLGYILANYAYKPINKIIQTLNNVDPEKLNYTVNIAGGSASELVNLSHQINRMFKRVKLMTQKQKDFILHASHELRRPMTKAVSALDIIALKQQVPADIIIKVRDDLMDVNTLLDSLLSLTPLKNNNLPSGISNLSMVVQQVLEKYSQEIKNKKIGIKTTMISEVNVPVPQNYLYIVVDNLISNAIKYCYPGTSILVNSKLGDSVILEIEDKGIGFNKKEAPEIFQKFFRSKRAKNLVSGYGLGLSIVKQICQLYKIKISIISHPGDGTKVYLQFPP